MRLLCTNIPRQAGGHITCRNDGRVLLCFFMFNCGLIVGILGPLPPGFAGAPSTLPRRAAEL